MKSHQTPTIWSVSGTQDTFHFKHCYMSPEFLGPRVPGLASVVKAVKASSRQRLARIEARGLIRRILRVQIEAGLQRQRLGGPEAAVASAQYRRVSRALVCGLQSRPPGVELPQEGAGGGLRH